MLAPPKIKFHWQLYTLYTVKESSNLRTAEPQFAYPSGTGHIPQEKTSARDNETQLWEDDYDGSTAEDTGYETDFSAYSNRTPQVPTRVTVTRVTPTLKKKKSIIMQRNLRRKNSRSAINRDTDMGDGVVFGDDDDDDDDVFDRST